MDVGEEERQCDDGSRGRSVALRRERKGKRTDSFLRRLPRKNQPHGHLDFSSVKLLSYLRPPGP